MVFARLYASDGGDGLFASSPFNVLLLFAVFAFLYSGDGFFAAVFALRLPLRGRGVMIRLVALVLGFVMFVFSEFLYARGEAEQLPFFVAAFAPVLLVSVSGGFILLHYEG